jgi:hypothetical protein
MIVIIGLIALLISYDKLGYFGFPQVVGIKHVIVCAIIFLIAFNKQKLVNVRVFSAFLILFAYLTIQFYFVEVRITSFIISFLFTLFPFVAFFIASSIVVSHQFILRLTKGLCLVMVLCALPAIVGALLGNELRVFSWMYREAGALGSAMVILCILTYFLFTQKAISYKTALIYLSVAMFIIAVSGLKKNFVSLIIVFSLMAYMSDFNKQLLRRAMVMIFIGFVFTFGTLLDNVQDNIDYFNNVGADGHIRVAMYVTAFRINADTFLFGSGLGSFGSLGALIGSITPGQGIVYELSPIYTEYGISNIGGNSSAKLNMGESGTLLDTYWPHIIGELGVVGFLLLMNVILQAFRNRPKATIVIPAMLLLSVFLDGFTLILPETPLFIFISFFMSGLILRNAKY